VLSAQFARDYPDLTLEIFHEAMRRIQLVDDLAIDRLLSYLSPWLRNISLATLDDKEILYLMEQLCVVTLRFGETFLDTLANVWLAFARSVLLSVTVSDNTNLTLKNKATTRIQFQSLIILCSQAWIQEIISLLYWQTKYRW